MTDRTKQRLVFLFCILLLCVTGLLARRQSAASPNFLNTYYPDAAWTMAVYCGFGCLFCRGVRLNLSAALLTSYAVECSQLLQTPFLQTLRATRLGGLVLGYGFLWSDLICYTAGALLCALVEYGVRKAFR